jgi:predicted adenylyl cyclase CyaB
MPNIEIKAYYPDLAKARRIARKLKARFVGRARQVDTFYKVAQGRLKLRESSLKGAELIPYVRPNVRGPKTSQYVVLPVATPSKTKVLLKGLLGVEGVVEKTRDLFLLGNVRIHLDQVKGLGNFLEFEAVMPKDSAKIRKTETTKVEKLLEIFQIAPKDLIDIAYRDMLKRKKSKGPKA